MLSSDLPRFLELEDFLDPYLKSKNETKEISDEKLA